VRMICVKTSDCHVTDGGVKIECVNPPPLPEEKVPGAAKLNEECDTYEENSGCEEGL
jgi:hypothetical protein